MNTNLPPPTIADMPTGAINHHIAMSIASILMSPTLFESDLIRKIFQPPVSNDNFETEIIPSVLSELDRLQVREDQSSAVKQEIRRGRRYPGRGVLGDPPNTLGPVDSQLWKLLQWIQLSYVAGFVDGEGCVTAVKNIRRDRPNDATRIRVIIVQNDRSVLDFVKNVLDCGGCINELKRQGTQNRPMHQLQYDGRHAVKVLMKLRCLLQRKRAEAEVCLRLFIEGQLAKRPGRRGLDPEIVKIRSKGIRRLQRMK